MIQGMPDKIKQILQHFEEVFSDRTWQWAEVLLIGAILCTGRRNVSTILRVMGQAKDKQFQNYHRVLNRAKWSGLRLSHILLGLLIDVFVPAGDPVVVGIDETLERRRGEKIKAKGIYRDSVRSSKSFFVKSSGLRWMSMMLLVSIPWAGRVWALPFLTLLAPSERYYKDKKRQPKTLTDKARVMIRFLKRWLKNRTIILVADSSYASLDLLAYCVGGTKPVTLITRLRLDSNLYDPPPVREAGTNGRPRLVGASQPKLAQRITDPQTIWERVTVGWYGGQTREVELASGTALWYHTGKKPIDLRWVLVRDPEGKFTTSALLCTTKEYNPAQIVEWFVMRWQLEVTFHEVRAHLGVETQRQWSELAIARTTPILLGLFSLVTLLAHQLVSEDGSLPIPQSAWYTKELPTFVDALALVRQQFWALRVFPMSPFEEEIVKIPRGLLLRLTDALAFAA